MTLSLDFTQPLPLPDEQILAGVLTRQNVVSAAELAVVNRRHRALWDRAEARFQAPDGRPLRPLRGCSYYVVDSGQLTDRAPYLSAEEAAELEVLKAVSRSFERHYNSPQQAHERIVARLAALRAERLLNAH